MFRPSNLMLLRVGPIILLCGPRSNRHILKLQNLLYQWSCRNRFVYEVSYSINILCLPYEFELRKLSNLSLHSGSTYCLKIWFEPSKETETSEAKNVRKLDGG